MADLTLNAETRTVLTISSSATKTVATPRNWLRSSRQSASAVAIGMPAVRRTTR